MFIFPPEKPQMSAGGWCRVSHGLVGKVCGEVVGTQRVLGERHSVPYLHPMYVPSKSGLGDRACETRPRSRGLVSRLVSQGLAARRNSTVNRFHLLFFSPFSEMRSGTHTEQNVFLLFTVVVTKHVWPYFQSRFPKTSSERVSSCGNGRSEA
jgi:hypothetical protein